MSPSGPPDKFPVVIDLSGQTDTQKQTTLNNAWTTFQSTYGMWPNTWVVVGQTIFIGAYV